MSFILLDDNLNQDSVSYLFKNPVDIICCQELSQVKAGLCSLNKSVQNGFYAAGFVSYELSQFFGFQTHSSAQNSVPLLCFGIFENVELLDNDQVEEFLIKQLQPHDPFLCDVYQDSDKQEYLEAIQKVKEHLEKGNSYQTNFTIRQFGKLGGCPARLYRQLRDAQPVEYGAYIDLGEHKILSRSPELFFEKKGEKLRVRPMKGTAPRHSDADHDRQEIEKLRTDEKQLAENVTIVDLLRNDLGQIAKSGSVDVKSLFDVETYKTVHQMTSTIECEIEPQLDIQSIFKALFPCGSITGAPKKKTCEIIHETEKSERGVYTGAIGFIAPNNDMCFSVPIRTLSLDQSRNYVFGTGSGIVYDSVPEQEYAECNLKAQFLTKHNPNFKLLECFYYSPQTGARHLDLHLQRMLSSSKSLGFDFDLDNITDKIHKALKPVSEEAKIRVEVAFDGDVMIEAVSLGQENNSDEKVYLSDVPTSSVDPVYRHKTTNREVYRTEFMRFRGQLGAYDVLFANELCHLTEASNHNIFLRFDDNYLTPPLSCGLLNGVGRQIFIRENRENVHEQPLPVDMLLKADEVLLVSSIRGTVPVEFVSSKEQASETILSHSK